MLAAEQHYGNVGHDLKEKPDVLAKCTVVGLH